MRKRLALACAAFAGVLAVAAPRAQESQPKRKKEGSAAASTPEELRRKMQRQGFERLRESNPQAYAEITARMERGEKMGGILKNWRGGKISRAQAEEELRPLLRQDTESALKGIDERIAQLEKELAFLKRAKDEPDLLTQRQLDKLMRSNAAGIQK